MALADLTAHQQRHPRVFRDAQDYLDTIEKEAAIADGTFDLTSEMSKARDVVSRMHTRLLHFEKNKDQVIDAVTDGLKKLTAAINDNPSLTEEDKITIMSKLDDLEKRLKCPLTEKGAGGPVEMSDSTMVNLQMAASESLTRIGERVQKLKSIEMITKESLSEWLGRFLQNLKKEFSNLTYTRPDGTFPIIEGVGEAMKNTGDVKRGI